MRCILHRENSLHKENEFLKQFCDRGSKVFQCWEQDNHLVNWVCQGARSAHWSVVGGERVLIPIRWPTQGRIPLSVWERRVVVLARVYTGRVTGVVVGTWFCCCGICCCSGACCCCKGACCGCCDICCQVTPPMQSGRVTHVALNDLSIVHFTQWFPQLSQWANCPNSNGRLP